MKQKMDTTNDATNGVEQRPADAEECREGGRGGASEGDEAHDEAMDALEHELNQVGLSVDDLRPLEGGSFDRRAMARIESARVMSRRFLERDRLKLALVSEQETARRRALEHRRRMAAEWSGKLKSSPFGVDLLAENERVDEENRVRLREEEKRQKMAEKRRARVKNEIMLQALSEASDIEALRREKRAILEEERRLQALLDVERAGGHRKAQHMAAQRAERQRHQAKADYRRRIFQQALAEHFERQAEALRERLDVPTPSGSSFPS